MIKYFKFGLLLLFIITEVVFYILYNLIAFSVFQGNEVLLKYISIIICLVFSIIFFVISCITEKGQNKSKISSLMVVVGLIFTLVSDTFLLLLNTEYILGVACFIVVQSAYLARIYIDKGKVPILSLAIRFGLFLIFVLVGLNFIDILVAIAGFYFINLTANMIEAFSLAKNKMYLLFAIGLVLFIGCDICVGLFNLTSYIDMVPKTIDDISTYGMWIFYLPSQVLIVASMYNLYSKENEKSSE